MTEHTLDALVKALLAEPPKPVDADDLSAADRDELADALRRAVSDLPAKEQRTRLAAAFRAMSTPGPDVAADLPPTPILAAKPNPAASRRFSLARPFDLARAGIVAGFLVVALVAGVLAGVATDDDDVAAPIVPAAAQDPVPVLAPISTGDQPPSPEYVAGFVPPSEEAQERALEEALAENPDMAEELPDAPDEPETSPEEGADSPAQFTGPISGYVDGTEIFGSADTADSGPTTSGDDRDGDGDGTDTTTPDGEDPTGGAIPGDAEETDPPGLVDLCAAEDPLPGCDGVGGTVLVELESEFVIYDMPDATPRAFAEWPGCTERYDHGELAADEFVIRVDSNDLGAFTVRYRIAGSGSEFTEVSGDTSEIWRSEVDSRAFATTCFVATRPGGPDAQRIELDVTGVRAGDDDVAVWAGVVDLAAAPETGVRRDGRPPVRVDAITSSTLHVTVPVGENENAVVRLVARREGSGGGCDLPSSADATALSSGSSSEPGDITLDLEWTYRRFEVSAPTPGSFLVCVDWVDDFDPPRNVERASIPVEILRVAGTELLVAGYEPAGAKQPDRIDVSGIRGSICGTQELTGGALTGSSRDASAEVVCSFDHIPPVLGVLANAELAGGSTPPARAILEPQSACATRDAESRDRWSSRGTCTTWYLLPIQQPAGSGFGLPRPSGMVVVGVRVDGYLGPDSVTIGDESSEFTDDAPVTGPRLLRDRVSARPDPESPSRRIIIDWATDVPATAVVRASPASPTPGCDPVSRRTTDSATEASLVLTGLCPGVAHLISFEFTGDDGERTRYGRDWGAGPAVVSSDGAGATTSPLSVVFDYEITIDPPTRTRGFIPLNITVGFSPGHRYEYSQGYEGEAYAGLDCFYPSEMTQAGSGVPLDVHGGVFPTPDLVGTYSTWPYRCPGISEQLRSVTIDRVVRGFNRLDPVGDSNLVDRMLSGEPAVFAARPNAVCGHSDTDGPSQDKCNDEVNVTVTMREVPGG